MVLGSGLGLVIGLGLGFFSGFRVLLLLGFTFFSYCLVGFRVF